MDDISQIIMDLEEGDTWHCIDIVPKIVTSSEYFDLDVHLSKNYLSDFAKKIANIMIKLIHYYPSQVYPVQHGIETEFDKIIGENMRQIPLIELSKIISNAAMYGKFYVDILLGDSPHTLISVDGNFSVYVFGDSKEVLELLELLVQQEGLFLIKIRDSSDLSD